MTQDIFTDLFHHCVLVAFVEQAAALGGWPDPELTRQRAYKLSTSTELVLFHRPR